LGRASGRTMEKNRAPSPLNRLVCQQVCGCGITLQSAALSVIDTVYPARLRRNDRASAVPLQKTRGESQILAR
jgi:hypothetical protein